MYDNNFFNVRIIILIKSSKNYNYHDDY